MNNRITAGKRSRTLSAKTGILMLGLSFAGRPAFALAVGLIGAASANTSLESKFLNPPDSAKAWTWWHWMNGNVTREGITADLEAMKSGGLGGAEMFDVSGKFLFNGSASYLNSEWLDLARHAASEAQRLGLKLGFHNCSGWSSSGGPWVTPAQSMQVLTTSRTLTEGPGRFDAALPQPPSNLGFYEDTVVVAYPVDPDRVKALTNFNPKVTSNAPGFDPALVLDGREDTKVQLPVPTPESPVYIDLEFSEPYTARAFSLDPGLSHQGYHGVLQVSDDGTEYRTVRSWWIRHARGKRSFSFPVETARYYRILFQEPDRDNYVYMNFGGLDFTAETLIDDWEQKAGYQPYSTDPNASQTVDPSEAVPLNQVIDLTSKISADGRLVWDVPAGNWAILRMGRTPLDGSGNYNNPASVGGSGLECDKFDADVVRTFWNGGPKKILDALNGYVGTTLTEVLIDSYERGQPNWTAKFPQEFERLRGYSMTPYLPAMTGRVVGSLEQSERFLWDVKRTISDLFAQNYSGTFAELAHTNNLQFGLESAGFIAEQMLYLGKSDMPIAVTWIGNNPPFNSVWASTAHAYGRKLVGGEVMTAQPESDSWRLDPYAMKAVGDASFCAGINKFMFHTFAHQPWTNCAPGMTAGQWGTHLDRGSTWWEQGRDWRIYLARCQYLLQQGRSVADGVFFCGENVPVSGPMEEGKPSYKYDSCNVDVLLNRMTVKDGRLVLPDGASYAFLGMNSFQEMTVPVLEKIRQLVRDGATVIGRKPLGSLGLAGYPQCDQQIQAMAEEVWGLCDGVTVKENTFGLGRVIWGKTTDAVLQQLQVLPDFEYSAAGKDIRFIHRTTPEMEIYFVSNQQDTFVQTKGTFRVSGKVPELWHADTGKTETAPLYEEVNGRTAVELSLEPRGSVFVIFRKAAAGTAHMVSGGTQTTTGSEPPYSVSVDNAGQAQLEVQAPGTYEFRRSDGKISQAVVDAVPSPVEIAGPWNLSFPPNLGAPAAVTLPALISWTEHSDPGVRYFSGTATYTKTITLSPDLFGSNRTLYLDLGAVKNLARIKLNGKDLGVVWKLPFRVDITAAAKAGDNDLEIELTNLWPNRLIGDEQLPADCEWNSDGGIKKLPDWFVAGEKSPSGRIAFTTWHHWTKDDALLPSGLLGPVQILTARKFDLVTIDAPVEPPVNESTNLIALWKFDGDLKDATTNHNDGTAMGTVSFAAGKYGQAASFTTVNSAVRVADNAMLDLTNALTIACWIKADTGTKMDLVTKGPSPGFSGNYPGNYEFRLQSEPDPRHLQFVWDPQTAGDGVDTKGSTGTMTPEVWTHVAVTVDSTAQTYAFYINGTAAGSGTLTTGLTANDYALLIGNLNADAPQVPFYGEIDDVAIFKKALSAGEISTVMGGDFSAYLPPAE